MNRVRLRRLILPLLMEQLLAVTVGFADTLMVSTEGQAAISGVALVDTINLLIIQIMAAFAAGGIVVISQYLGETNTDKARSASKHLEYLIYSFAFIVMAVFLVFGRVILHVLFGKVEAAVMDAAYTYMLITAVSLFFWGLYTSGAAILRCQENTRTSMKVSVLMNLLNVVLNAILVFIMKWGVMGVAVATLISRAIAGVIMKIIIVSDGNKLKTWGDNSIRLTPSMMKRILAMGVPSGIENGMFHVGKIALTSVIATLGTTAIAANTVAYQIIEFPNIPGNTIGLALVVIVGQDIGAGLKDSAVSDTRFMLKLAYIGDWICKILLFVLAPVIVSFFGLEPEGVHTAVLVLRCFSIASLPIWPLSFTMPSALRGAGDVTYSMVVSIISMWVGRVAVSYILITTFGLGVLGVWIGMFVDWYIRGISYLVRFMTGKWLDKKVV